MNSDNSVPIEARRDGLVRGLLIAMICLLGLVVVLQVLAALCSATNLSWWTYLKDEAALTLEQTPFSGQPAQHSAYKSADGSRSDWVGAGSLALPATNISIMITRFTRPRQVTNTVVKTLREFSELNNVQPKFQAKYYALATRLGELRAVSFDVNADGIAKRCLGFHTPGSNAVFVKGYVCAGDQAAVAPQQVACLVDRVRFVRQADEDALKAIQGHSESRECSATLLDPRNDANEEPAKDAQ